MRTFKSFLVEAEAVVSTNPPDISVFGFIYATLNEVNGKAYIGMCAAKTENGRKKYLGSGIALKDAIKKYGRKSFTRYTLEECVNDHDLRVAEKKWIDLFSASKSPHFYNMCEGGRGGHTHDMTDEQKEQLSDRTQKYWDTITPEDREYRCKQMKEGCGSRDSSGDKNSMFGRSAVKEKNLKWYNNGTQSLYITEGTQPAGFERGRGKVKW